MNKFKFGFAISKIDEEEQMVYGYASTPDLDSQGEIIKLSAIKKALPGYLQFPTIREMHQAKAVGVTKEAKVDEKGLYIGAKVVDKAAWELVKEGVYKAFSIGGDVVKRVGHVISELELIEISLVDVPANKAAVIEVWKRGEISKDAETAYSMANLMITIKEIIYYYEYLGKDTKKLKKVLEIVKQILVQEASEPENEGGGMTVEDARQAKTLKYLESITFKEGSMEEALRKGVILGMKSTVTKAEDQDDPKTDETVKEEETEETVETETEETTEEGEAGSEDAKEGEETEETTTDDSNKEDDQKETKDDPTLTKIQEAENKLSELAPKVEKSENPTLAKSIDTLAGSFSKMVDVLTDINKRVAELEKTPAAPKSRSAVVFKSEDKTKEEKSDSSANDATVKVKKARLAELEKEYDTLGANEFAKRGLSLEATQIKNELAQLGA